MLACYVVWGYFRLKINLNKSELSWECLRDDIEVLVDDIGCKVGSC